MQQSQQSQQYYDEDQNKNEEAAHPENAPSKTTIDWQALRQEMGWAAQDGQNQDASIQALLQQRARQYAAILPDDQHAAALRVVLVFMLGAERYGVDVMHIKTVRYVEKITPVPGLPVFYRGVVNIRGQIITLLDLRPFFGIPIQQTQDPRELILVQVNNLEIGLLAHRVQEMLTLPEQEINPVEDIRYAQGITHDQVLILDMRRLFEDERLIVGGVDD